MAGELLPPDGMTLAAVSVMLVQRLGVRDGRRHEADRGYYDTFDGLLHEAGLVLVHEDGVLELVERDTGRSRARLPRARPAGPLFARELELGPLRELLLKIIEVRALLPLVQIRSRERGFDVLDEQGKTVVRLALAAPALGDPALAGPGELRPRLRLLPVRGYDKALERLQRELQDELDFTLAEQPLVDEAVRVAGAVPGGISSKIELPLRPEQRADSAAAAVLRRLLEVMEANFEGTVADVDSEFLHDFRVSVRRSRSVQRELKRVFPPRPLERFRAEFRWLQQVTGDARDLDVYVLEFDDFRQLVPAEMRADLKPLLSVLGARRRRAHRNMERALRSPRTVSLLADWAEFLDGLEGLDDGERPDAARPIGAVAGRRIRKVYERMRTMGEAIDEHSPAEAYHDLRKQGKELRYLLELFGAPLYPAEVVRPMIKSLKALQDVLGRHQDREVQMATVHALGVQVARRRGGADALMAMGALVQRLGEDELAARQAFAERFQAFTSKSQRRLVGETFT
jgi:CHAD domain-containing protein